MNPVSVWETHSTKRTLGDVEGAARFLLERWPVGQYTEFHQAARQAAWDVLTGATTIEAFRATFIAAAEEAGILA
ncbi:DUF982 domain-containing protein [Ancylobacter sonchi]|nr:DUF982 domain-containing protein [Ancylobacter sonchi]